MSTTEKKPKPPRPPAPNLTGKKNIKKQAASGLSFSFNDLKSVDSDDEDKSFVQFTKSGSHDPLPDVRRTKNPVSMPNASSSNDSKTKEMKPMTSLSSSAKSRELKSFSRSEDRDSVEDIHDAVSHPLGSKPVEVSKPVAEQVQRVQEELQRSSPPKFSCKKENGQENVGLRGKTKLEKGGSGILKVTTEVLEERENESFKLPDSQEALSDPLSFLDKVMEDELDGNFDDDADVGNKTLLRQRNGSGGNQKRVQQQQRTKSLDVEIGSASGKGETNGNSLDINPCYFNVPTPDDLKDEPVRANDGSSSGKPPKKPQAKVMSLSGLLASPDITEEKKPLQNGSDGFRTPDMPPDETDWSTVEKKSHPDSPPPTSSQMQSPVEEHKPTQTLADTPLHPLPFYTLYTLTLLIFTYYLFPLPIYVSGFLTGVICSFYLVLFLIWINLPPTDKSFKAEDATEYDAPLVIPGPRLTANRVRFKEQEKINLKGWMNELSGTYNPETYHVNQTHSIYIRLEGHTLRLSRPKHNIARRAMFDEPNNRPEFVHQRIYDIRGSKVFLQPDGLVKKRMWSKKYPLFIELPQTGLPVEKKEDTDETAHGMGFDVIKDDECGDDKVLVLFARTGREKEEWFWKFEGASKSSEKTNRTCPIQTLNKKVLLVGNDFIGEDGDPVYRGDPEDMTRRKAMVDFYKFLAKILPKEKDVKELMVQDIKAKAGGVTYASPGRGHKKGVLEREGSISGGIPNDAPVGWVNALIGRLFWDFLREERWAEIVQTKLQKKLSKIKIPHFMEALTITETDLGLHAPTIRKASKPTVDSRGMWVDLEIHYGGSCWMTLTTKFNLWKLGKDSRMEREMEDMKDMMSGRKEGIEKLERVCRPPKSAQSRSKKKGDRNPNKKTASNKSSMQYSALNHPPHLHGKHRRQMSAALDSDEEDSAESSDDEPVEETNSTTSTDSGTVGDEGIRSSSKILRFVNKVANTSYFQRATQNKYVKRALDEVSNTAVELTVEVKELRGVLAVNIPPPPSDRLWYGFRGKPHLWLSAKPKLGSRQVTITHITEYIERKLEKEFQKVFVLPNMDDIPIPIMDFKIDENRFSS